MIEKEAADRLGMAEFGTFHCHGMMQHVPSKLRQCATIRLGPMTMESPIFMEMALTGIVKGGPGRVVGIIGYTSLHTKPRKGLITGRIPRPLHMAHHGLDSVHPGNIEDNSLDSACWRSSALHAQIKEESRQHK